MDAVGHQRAESRDSKPWLREKLFYYVIAIPM